MGRENVTVRTPGDIANVVPRILGFRPEDSVVVLADAGPSARVDLGTPDEMTEAFAPALPHWTGTVIVAFYTHSSGAAHILCRSLNRILPGVKIGATLRIHDGHTFDPSSPDLPGVPFEYGETSSELLNSLPVAATREEIVAEANEITDAAEVERRALKALYEDGNGARAWVYLGRATALGHTSDALRRLENDLTEINDPYQED